MYNKVYVDWTEFKSLIDESAIQWKFNEIPDRYDLFGIQGGVTYITSILKDEGADQTDFENNYKSNPTSVIRNITESVFKQRAESFNTIGTGVLHGDGSAIRGFSLQVTVGSGIPTAWVVTIEGSLDGVHFDSILSHTDRDGLNKIVSTGTSNKFVSYYRVMVSSLTLGISPSINISVLEVK